MQLNQLSATASLAIVGILLSTAAVAQEQSTNDDTKELLIAAQKICPVSGADLHAMGEPVKAKSGKQTLFLCCKECLGKPISKEHWARVHSNLAAAQGKCPVMGRPLPKGAASVLVDGRKIFVCCPPCIKKIQADAEKYVATVDALIKKNLAKGQDREE